MQLLDTKGLASLPHLRRVVLHHCESINSPRKQASARRAVPEAELVFGDSCAPEPFMRCGPDYTPQALTGWLGHTVLDVNRLEALIRRDGEAEAR